MFRSIGRSTAMARPKKKLTADELRRERRRERREQLRQQIPPACFTVTTFCLAHHISESFFFKLRNDGLGPREMQLGGRILITFEDAAAWRAERVAATATAAE